MSFRSFTAFVFFLIVPSAIVAQVPLVSHWEKVGPVNFTALVNQSPTRIVAATDHGYLYITGDDGVTWHRQEVSDTVDINGIAFGDSLHGALLASGNLMLSSDGGATWHAHNAPLTGLSLVGALGEDTSLVGGPAFQGNRWVGKLFRSTDAGANWDTVLTDTASGYWSPPMKIVFFFGKGFAIGGSLCAQTTDAGAHWTEQILNADIRDIDFYNSETGAIASTAGYYVTTDGGTNWSFTADFHDERDDNYMTVTFFGPRSFFMFGTPNAYYYTSNDLGATVSLADMRQASSISNVIKTPDGAWIAVGGGIDPNGFPYGGGGIILRGTITQETMTTPQWTVVAECPFSSGVAFHATNGATLECAAGSYPLISSDSGIFWHVTDLHAPDYGAMHFPTQDTGYLYYVGSQPSVYGGVNLKTVDSGQSWNPVVLSPAYVFNATFGSSDTGYGFSGSLVRTTDGGVNWLPDSIPFSTFCPYLGYKVYQTSMTGIASPDGLDAYVTVRVSDTLIVQTGPHYYDGEKTHVAVYKTSDAGMTWSSLTDIPILGAMQSIYFRNASLGFVTSDSGRIYRTSDGGSTWRTEQIAPFQYLFNSINFLNDQVGFLTLDSAAVLATTDAGLSWTWLTIPTNREEIQDAQIQFIVGQDTIQNAPGMSTQEVFFPDSTTVLISFVRTLLNINPPPQDTVIDGDTIVEFTSTNLGVHEQDYGFYRGTLSLPPASVQSMPAGAEYAFQLSIYPNPAGNQLHVDVSNPLVEATNVEVLDVLGRPVLAANELENNFLLDLHLLPNGVYTLHCQSGYSMGLQRFMIAR